jgi:hypothetical protein
MGYFILNHDFGLDGDRKAKWLTWKYIGVIFILQFVCDTCNMDDGIGFKR